MNLAYDLYKEGHARLFTAKTHPQIHEASRDTVEYYLENRLIWKEFNHYKETGTILGEHPIFSWMKRADQIRSMKIGDLVNLKIRLNNNLVKNRAKIRKEPNHPQTMVRQELIKKQILELAEVNRLLNL